ncbi:MAG: CheR family methyltransferase [Desulfosoma sp.]
MREGGGVIGGMDGVRRVAAWAREHLGLLEDPSAASEIGLKLGAAARAHGFADAEAFVRHLFDDLSPSDRLRTLASVLTIGETYFFREPQALQIFKQDILPEIMHFREDRGQRRLVLWSAGCSTGEEAYTLAMIVKEALHGRPEWDFSVSATDINEKALEMAREGLYRPWSFRKPVPPEYRKYFVRLEAENLWRVRDDIKRHVTFSVLNLASAHYPSPQTHTMDVDALFCRNVLMYFDPKTRAEVLRRFHGALNEAGWLILGASEIHTASGGPWESVRYPEAVFLRKRQGGISRERSQNVPPCKRFPENGRLLETPALFASASAAEKRSADPTLSSKRETGPVSSDHGMCRLLASGRLEEAVALVERDLGGSADMPLGEGFRDAILQVVQALAARGRAEKALNLLDRVLAVHKFDPALYHMKGALHAELGQGDEAVAAFRQMLYVAPQSATALLSLGMLSRREGHPDAARRYLEGALKLLEGKDDREEVPYSDGMSVGQTRRMVERFLNGLRERPGEGS